MTPKTVITALLLLFVGASVAWVAISETRDRPNTSAGPAAPAPGPKAVPPAVPPKGDAASASVPEAPVKGKVVATYFHSDARCKTCRTIEAYAREAVETGFPEALKDGRLEWRTVNVSASDNDRYVKEFSLTSQMVVLERYAGDERREWKALERVWELVRDKAAFQPYVKAETKAFLETAGP